MSLLTTNQYQYVSAQSLGASFNGNPISMLYLKGFVLALNVTGATAAGTFKLQLSNDRATDDQGSGITNWFDITGASQVIAGPLDFYFTQQPFYAAWARLVWTRTGGTGSVSGMLVSKIG